MTRICITISPEAILLYHHRLCYCITRSYITVSPEAVLLDHQRLYYCITIGYVTVSPEAVLLYHQKRASSQPKRNKGWNTIWKKIFTPLGTPEKPVKERRRYLSSSPHYIYPHPLTIFIIIFISRCMYVKIIFH